MKLFYSVHVNLSSRGVLHVHRPGGVGFPLCPGLPPRDPGPAAGGHREPVLRSALLLWSLLTQWQSPHPIHPGKRQQLPPLWQRSLRCRVDWEAFLSPLCPLVFWCGEERYSWSNMSKKALSSPVIGSKLSPRQSSLFFFPSTSVSVGSWSVFLFYFFKFFSLPIIPSVFIRGNIGARLSSIRMNRVHWNSFAGKIIIPGMLCLDVTNMNLKQIMVLFQGKSLFNTLIIWSLKMNFGEWFLFS